MKIYCIGCFIIRYPGFYHILKLSYSYEEFLFLILSFLLFWLGIQSVCLPF